MDKKDQVGLSGDVEHVVKSLIMNCIGVKSEDINPESNLIDDLGMDSLDFVELLIAIEEEFEIDIDDEAADAMVTVGDIVNYVKEH